MVIFKFELKDRVRIIGKGEVWTVEDIHEIPGGETKYWIQLGADFKTRIWAEEGTLELADVS